MDTLSILVHSLSDRKLVPHHLVDTLGFLTLATGHPLEVDILIHMDDFAADQQVASLPLIKVWQNPWLFLPLLDALLDKVFKSVGRPLLLLLVSLLFFSLGEDQLEHKAEELPGVFDIGEQKDIE